MYLQRIQLVPKTTSQDQCRYRVLCIVFHGWSLVLSCIFFLSMSDTIITCLYLSAMDKKGVPVILMFCWMKRFQFCSLFTSYIEFNPLNAVFACWLHSSNHPPSVSFWDLRGEWFSSANKLQFSIEFLCRSKLSVVIKQLKMTQSAKGPASGKMLSISCQQWPLGLPSHGTGKQGIVSSWVWLRDHTGSIVSSSLGSYCSSASGKGRAFTYVVC